ncbi:Uncharacterized protein MSYG_1781 [Malassezia sympodialis ATCC 42132]|uniref:Uncharacterized protein n=1 Tax=Malassezia sympodialis (strain ATCC 42132) TaxID=1230383 RepID=A0A1M8A4U6_MALS4|nr:Uncharacterized protein MSYG_1781 [Malassezia sympodialis ATCC 42132]
MAYEAPPHEYRTVMGHGPEGPPPYYYDAPPPQHSIPVPDPGFYGPPPRPGPPPLTEHHRPPYSGGAPDHPMRSISPPRHGRYAMEPMDYFPMGPGNADMRPPLHDDPAMLAHDPMAVEMGMRMPISRNMHDPGLAPPPARLPSGSHRPPKRMPPPLAEAPISKRDRKRKEVLDRLERTHWEGFENRDPVYHEAYVSLSSMHHALLTRPSLVREYALQLADRTVERGAQLRSAELYYAFLVERSKRSSEAERSKVEDEARLAKRHVRDKLLAVIEERKHRLKEERDGGDFAADFLLEPSQRQHSTRQLRNKSSHPNGGPTRLGRLLDYEDSATGSRQGVVDAVAQLLGWSEMEAAATITAASADENTLLCKDAEGTEMRLPLLDTFSMQTSLLAGVSLAATASNGKGKKKGSKLVSTPSERSEDDDAPTTPLLSSGGGRLRWDTAKCLSQLTLAKDFEIESDLININKLGQKRRRR